MALAKVSIRLDTELADEVKRILGAKSRSEAIRIALERIVEAHRARKLALQRLEKQDTADFPLFM